MNTRAKISRLIISWIALLACSLLAADEPSTNRPADLPNDAKMFLNLPYVPNGSTNQMLDLYLPGTGTNFPLIVWIHGGAWMAGSKEKPPGLRLVLHGFALASLNYRLSQDAIFPAQLIDCKAAVRWLRAHAADYSIDPNRIAVWGASAGGHLVALLGTTGDTTEFDQGENTNVSSRVQAVVDWFGPTDFLQITNYPSVLHHADAKSPESLLIGGVIGENPDKAERANPIHYITKDAPPFLIMHGDKDPLVPWQQSQILADALKKAGVPVQFHIVPGAGHGTEQFHNQESKDILYNFLVKNLKGD